MTSSLTIKALMERVHQHIRVEKDNAHAKGKSCTTTMSEKKPPTKVNVVERKDRPCRNNRGEDPKARRLRVCTAITTAFKKPIYRILSEIHDEPFVRRLVKLGEVQRGYDEIYRCTFHDEVGLQTEDCTSLRQHLKELVATGHLDQYIEGGAQPAFQDGNVADGMPANGPPQGVINLIHRIIELK
ncbi:uncharacterized protein LOC114275548 [Camellia sinensis]|uniref:uncharacterized protein LOC114275548 n=1 Tax=Camellia sinensis TaxID=4442 RepID=UPI00103676E7|nr:uncharacterized protein LOC114275548 [Camellia sinensis]